MNRVFFYAAIFFASIALAGVTGCSAGGERIAGNIGRGLLSLAPGGSYVSGALAVADATAGEEIRADQARDGEFTAHESYMDSQKGRDLDEFWEEGRGYTDRSKAPIAKYAKASSQRLPHPAAPEYKKLAAKRAAEMELALAELRAIEGPELERDIAVLRSVQDSRAVEKQLDQLETYRETLMSLSAESPSIHVWTVVLDRQAASQRLAGRN